MFIINLLLILLFGLLIGSFVSAVTYRIPRNQGFIKGRSFCDNCKKNLFWYDNIPLFSFLFYLGKSRCCNKKISIRYPLIELSSAVGFVLLFATTQWQASLIYYPLFTISLAILIIDLEHQFIPDELSWLVLFLSLFVIHNSIFINLFSAFLFAFFLLILNLITRGRGMGLGDVKLAIPLGLWLGFEKGLIWLTTSFIIGGIVASILLLLKKANMKTKIPFGPFLILAFWLVLIIYR